jgi:hypothetical protein
MRFTSMDTDATVPLSIRVAKAAQLGKAVVAAGDVAVGLAQRKRTCCAHRKRCGILGHSLIQPSQVENGGVKADKPSACHVC